MLHKLCLSPDYGQLKNNRQRICLISCSPFPSLPEASLHQVSAPAPLETGSKTCEEKNGRGETAGKQITNADGGERESIKEQFSSSSSSRPCLLLHNVLAFCFRLSKPHHHSNAFHLPYCPLLLFIRIHLNEWSFLSHEVKSSDP